MAHVSDIKLIRTDTTLDLSQKAEKGMLFQGPEALTLKPHLLPASLQSLDVGLNCSQAKIVIMSDETLLQKDNSEDFFLSSEFSGGIRLNNTTDAAIPTNRAGRLQNNRYICTTLNYVSSNPRTEQMFQASSHGESSLSTDHHMHAGYGNSHCFQQTFENNLSSHDTHAGYSHSYYSQKNFSNQFGRPFIQSFNHMNLNLIHSEMSNQNGDIYYANDRITDVHSSATMLGNKMPSGQKATHSAATSLPPSSHCRRI
ncbi:uncharacterized protein [Typha latifolia]|uniref:uncharacterized protein n=1 Tax=Typha latifolia TaxID=4733 RepID=UPI003C2D9F30